MVGYVTLNNSASQLYMKNIFTDNLTMNMAFIDCTNDSRGHPIAVAPDCV